MHSGELWSEWKIPSFWTSGPEFIRPLGTAFSHTRTSHNSVSYRTILNTQCEILEVWGEPWQQTFKHMREGFKRTWEWTVMGYEWWGLLYLGTDVTLHSLYVLHSEILYCRGLGIVTIFIFPILSNLKIYALDFPLLE